MATFVVGGAQMGPIQKADDRRAVVARMVALLDEAAGRGVEMLVYPELALTTFFPRWYAEDRTEFDRWSSAPATSAWRSPSATRS